MTWTSPRTWSAGETVTPTIMNTHVRDNLNALKAPPTDLYNFDEGADYTTTTSANFTDVDATDLQLSIDTTGGDVLIWFFGTVNLGATAADIYFNVVDNGVAVAANDGLIQLRSNGITNADTSEFPIAFIFLQQSVTAGNHLYKLQWKTSSGDTVTLRAGAGTSNKDTHPQFGCREIS